MNYPGIFFESTNLFSGKESEKANFLDSTILFSAKPLFEGVFLESTNLFSGKESEKANFLGGGAGSLQIIQNLIDGSTIVGVSSVFKAQNIRKKFKGDDENILLFPIYTPSQYQIGPIVIEASGIFSHLRLTAFVDSIVEGSMPIVDPAASQEEISQAYDNLMEQPHYRVSFLIGPYDQSEPPVLMGESPLYNVVFEFIDCKALISGNLPIQVAYDEVLYMSIDDGNAGHLPSSIDEFHLFGMLADESQFAELSDGSLVPINLVKRNLP